MNERNAHDQKYESLSLYTYCWGSDLFSFCLQCVYTTTCCRVARNSRHWCNSTVVASVTRWHSFLVTRHQRNLSLFTFYLAIKKFFRLFCYNINGTRSLIVTLKHCSSDILKPCRELNSSCYRQAKGVSPKTVTCWARFSDKVTNILGKLCVSHETKK